MDLGRPLQLSSGNYAAQFDPLLDPIMKSEWESEDLLPADYRDFSSFPAAPAEPQKLLRQHAADGMGTLELSSARSASASWDHLEKTVGALAPLSLHTSDNVSDESSAHTSCGESDRDATSPPPGGASGSGKRNPSPDSAAESDSQPKSAEDEDDTVQKSAQTKAQALISEARERGRREAEEQEKEEGQSSVSDPLKGVAALPGPQLRPKRPVASMAAPDGTAAERAAAQQQAKRPRGAPTEHDAGESAEPKMFSAGQAHRISASQGHRIATKRNISVADRARVKSEVLIYLRAKHAKPPKVHNLPQIADRFEQFLLRVCADREHYLSFGNPAVIDMKITQLQETARLRKEQQQGARAPGAGSAQQQRPEQRLGALGPQGSRAPAPATEQARTHDETPRLHQGPHEDGLGDASRKVGRPAQQEQLRRPEGAPEPAASSVKCAPDSPTSTAAMPLLSFCALPWLHSVELGAVGRAGAAVARRGVRLPRRAPLTVHPLAPKIAVTGVRMRPRGTGSPLESAEPVYMIAVRPAKASKKTPLATHTLLRTWHEVLVLHDAAAALCAGSPSFPARMTRCSYLEPFLSASQLEDWLAVLLKFACERSSGCGPRSALYRRVCEFLEVEVLNSGGGAAFRAKWGASRVLKERGEEPRDCIDASRYGRVFQEAMTVLEGLCTP